MATTSFGRSRRRGLAFRRHDGAPPSSLPPLLHIPDTAIPDGWFLFDDVDLDGGSGGKVLVGVRGVYAVASHRAEGKVTISKTSINLGGRADELDLAALRARAARVAEALGVPVSPLIVVEADGVALSWIGDLPVVGVAHLRSFLINSTARRVAWDEFKRIRSQLDQLVA